MYKYMANIINTLNHNQSMDKVKSTTHKITKMLGKVQEPVARPVVLDQDDLDKQ